MKDQASDSSFMPPRRLRVLAFDPGTGNKFLNRRIRTITISLPWEFDPSDPNVPFLGPRGEYVEVIDYDPASGAFYEPINLNEKQVLLNDGVSPSEEDPRFHQQMVYAVSMETIALFEQALGRRILWAPRSYKDKSGRWHDEYVQRLRIYPHALREANAYYDPRKKSLLFGYFTAGEESRSAPPGTTVFTCLSHDIVVHETCHAILDGLHPRFAESSHPDMLALHEGFSDIVAIFQQFSHPEVLEDQIARTRGDLERQSLLAELAQEFGEAIGRGGALRDALGSKVDGVWKPREPHHRAIAHAKGPHARGAILVAAVFRAFLTIYKSRVADLFRIASGGSGILRDGAVDPDLVKRLAKEAAMSAGHVLQICIRAMDYVTPVSVSFGDYLRAIITADHDLFPEDDKGYRRAFIEAFTAWGIRPEGMPVVTENALLWPSLREAADDAGYDDKHFLPFKVRLNEMVYWASRPAEAISKLADAKLIPAKSVKNLRANMEEVYSAFLDGTDKRSDHYNYAEAEQKIKKQAEGEVESKKTFNINLLEMDLNVDRKFIHEVRNFYAHLFWGIICQWPDEMLNLLGVATGGRNLKTIRNSSYTGKPKLDVYSVRIARRAGKRGQSENEYVVELIQSRDGYMDKDKQTFVDRSGIPQLKLNATQKFYTGPGATKVPVDPVAHAETKGRNKGKLKTAIDDPDYRYDFRYRAGATLLIDARTFQIRRVIRTPYMVDDDRGLDALRQHLDQSSSSARNAFDSPEGMGDRDHAFAMLHRHTGTEGH